MNKIKTIKIIEIIINIITIIIDYVFFNHYYSASGSICDSGDMIVVTMLMLFGLFIIINISRLVKEYICEN